MDDDAPARAPGVEIAAGHKALRAALLRGSAAEVAALYTTDARMLAPSAAVLTGREAIERFWQAGLDTGLATMDLHSLEVRETDSLAYEIGWYEMRLLPVAAASVVDRGKYLLVHRLDTDGTWRRAVEMFSPDRSPTVAAQAVPLEGSPAPATG